MKIKIRNLFKRFKIKFIVAMILFAVLILSFFFAKNIEYALGLRKIYLLNQVVEREILKSDFKVSYIDVGQGNSTFIRFPDGKVMLIDGGNIDYSQKIVNFLKDEGVDKIDYLVATHADSDHIAGLNLCLEEFEVKNIYRPFQIAGTGTSLEEFIVYEDEDLGEFYRYITDLERGNTKISRITTQIYKNFITNIYSEFYQENGNFYKSNVTVFYDGLEISGENYQVEFFAPLVRDGNYNLANYSNTNGFATMGFGTTNSNDNSAIILININNNKFLFTGDASWSSNLYEDLMPEDSKSVENRNYAEIEFLNSLTDDERLKFKNISVYMLGHHGSSFSSSDELLKLIDAKFFIVSAGKDNSFGHPSADTLARIRDYKKIEDYLIPTADSGTITFGVVGTELKYCLNDFENDKSLIISWYILGIILYILIVMTIFGFKTKSERV